MKKNIVKGWVTSIIGVITMIISLFLVFFGQIDFVWDGIAGLSIGTVLLMAPQTIERQFTRIFSGMTTKTITPQEPDIEEPKEVKNAK